MKRVGCSWLLCAMVAITAACGAPEMDPDVTPTAAPFRPDRGTETKPSGEGPPAQLLTTATALPSRSPTPEPLAPTLTQTPVTATAAPRTPTPSATAPPVVRDLVAPLVVDSKSGRLYVTGRVAGSQQIVALAAADGRLLSTYGMTGTFAIDPARGWLYVDQNENGLLVMDAQTGEKKTLISLPSSQQRRMIYPAPVADPSTGQVLAFRDHSVYVIDPDQGAVVTTIPFTIPKARDCRSLTNPLPIEWAVYDDTRRLLYLNFVTYVCTPWIGETLVSFDMDARTQVAQQGVTLATATASNGSLYGSSWYRMGVGYRWAWRDGQPWFESEGWNNRANLFVDQGRGRLYESSVSHGFRVFDLETMSLLFILPSPVDGDLVGYDPGTDQLYYLQEGQLTTWPGGAILPPSSQALQMGDPPARPVRHLNVLSGGTQAHTLFGLWDYRSTGDNCYVFGAQGGQFYLSADSGKVWGQPQGGLDVGCQRISALAVSPDYATDPTMLAALVGNGIFRSTDGGQLWQPASIGLRSISVEKILLSPGFELDQTAFCRSRAQGQGNLYRSIDGGATWEGLGVDLSLVAMSPEFDRDRVLMGIAVDQVLVSGDRGETWEGVGNVPDGDMFTRLSLAPLFDRWQVVFAFGAASQNLYRSVDGGRSWDVVLSVGGHAYNPFPPQLAYGPETEQGRLLFLLATDTDPNADPPRDQGTLYRSEDGGVSWEALALPADLAPTALALSSTYAQDGLLWLGTADSRVIPLEAAQLHGGP